MSAQPKKDEEAVAPPPSNPRLSTLAEALAGPLPGEAGQRLMWPSHLPTGRFRDVPADARLAAVLILLYEEEGTLRFPLQRRRAVDGDPHGGQISLPGGAREGREKVEETALREAREEMGIDPDQVRILGRLSRRWVPVSHYKVRPVVGWTERVPEYRLDPREVDELIVCSLDELEDPRRMVSFPRRWEGVEYQVPGWRLESGILWGATAMILAELITLLRTAEGSTPLPGPVG
jgi:8-oxo-dGTP pyrophosphatase MutT (NUDIX family)